MNLAMPNSTHPADQFGRPANANQRAGGKTVRTIGLRSKMKQAKGSDFRTDYAVWTSARSVVDRNGSPDLDSMWLKALAGSGKAFGCFRFALRRGSLARE
jgi:hypothetical protein